MTPPAIWPVELRQEGRELVGSVPFNEAALLSDRGNGPRKEVIRSTAWDWSLTGDGRNEPLDLLAGHAFSAPLASRQAGTLALAKTSSALTFRATLPPEAERPSWVTDAALAVRSKLVQGVSPGFSIPPASRVPNAVRLVREPGTGVLIRELLDVRLVELSLVTRAAFRGSNVDLRAEDVPGEDLPDTFRVWL